MPNAFEANDIDIDLLGQVDDQVLKDIGVSSAGHRLRIRNAIARLRPALGATTGDRSYDRSQSIGSRPSAGDMRATPSRRKHPASAGMSR